MTKNVFKVSKRTMGLALFAASAGYAFVGHAMPDLSPISQLYVPYKDVKVSQISTTKTHPSLFFSESELPAIRKRSLALPWMQDVRTELRKKADSYMRLSASPYPLVTEYNGIGTAGRALQNFVGTLAFAGYLFEEPQYLNKAKELLLAVVKQTEPDNRKHWRSHLQVGDATQGMVLGYDLVYPLLSEEERKLVLDEIEKFAHQLTHKKSTWGMDARGVLSCNHSTVHYGALGLAALALWERDIPEKTEWMQRAIGRVDGYLDTFIDSDGYGTEGHHYFAYGLGGSSVFAWALKRSNGPDLLAKHSNVALAADQVLWKVLPVEGRMLALNDNVETVPTDVAGMVGALTYNQPHQLWAWLESIYKSGQTDKLAGSATTTFTTPFLFMWGDKPVAPIHPKDVKYKLGHHFESGRVFLRSSWEGKDAAHVSMTSGYDFHRGHDQQDENSVTFFAYGEGFLIDPQYEPERSEAHTTLRIRGAEQIKSGDGYIAKYREDEFGALVQGQAEEAYDFDKVVVGYADRKTYFVRGPVPYLVFRDDAQVEDDRAGEMVSRYITYPNNTILADGKAAIIQGERGKASARLMVFSEGKQVQVVEDDMQSASFVNRGRTYQYKNYLRRLSATVDAVNPKFLSILIPFKNQQDIPPVSVYFDKPTDTYVLTLEFSTHTDTVYLNQSDVLLKRE
jgi:hypothetical protein